MDSGGHATQHNTIIKETIYKGKTYYFINEISNNLLCPIDKALFKQPVIACCGHTFCQNCILQLLDKSKEPECPVDKSSLNEKSCLIPNLVVEGQIAELLVFCKYSLIIQGKSATFDPNGCKKQVKFADIVDHEKHCEFATITCPHCSDTLLRKDFEEHKRKCSKCPCPHNTAGCDFYGNGESIANHIANCQYEKIKGFLCKSDSRFNEIKKLLLDRESENVKIQESLSLIHKQLEQVFSMIDANNTRVEGSLRFLSANVEELKTKTGQSENEMRELKKEVSERLKTKSLQKKFQESDKRIVDGKAKNLQPGLVPGVPGLNITVHGSYQGHTGPVWALAASEGMIISGSSDTTVKIWDISTGTCKMTLTGHQGIVHAVAVNNKHVISGSCDKLIKVWDIETGKCLRTLSQHENTVCSLVVGGGFIFSGSFTEIKVWNINTYQEEATLRGHNHWVRAIAIQGRVLYCGSHNIIKVWNLDTFQCTGTITAQCGSIYSLAVSNNRLLAGTFENLIYVWELGETFRCITTLPGHFGAVYNLCVSGDKLFSASYDTSIRVWSLDTLRCLQTIGHHSSSVEALLLWNGYLFSGSADATIKVWR